LNSKRGETNRQETMLSLRTPEPALRELGWEKSTIKYRTVTRRATITGQRVDKTKSSYRKIAKQTKTIRVKDGFSATC